jgi:hypothetical protein
MNNRKKPRAPRRNEGPAKTSSQKRGPGPVPGLEADPREAGKQPLFIVTQSSLPTDTEAEANGALFDRCIQTQGFIRVRLEPRVYDPQTKRYVSLLGQALTLHIWDRGAAEGLLLGLRQSLLEEEREQRGKRAG